MEPSQGSSVPTIVRPAPQPGSVRGNFKSVADLQIEDLPPGWQHPETLDVIDHVSQRVVMIYIPRMSSERPSNIFSDQPHYGGTGFAYYVDHDIVKVRTNLHVIFNAEEAASATVQFSLRVPGKQNARLVRLRATSTDFYTEAAQDFSCLTCRSDARLRKYLHVFRDVPISWDAGLHAHRGLDAQGNVGPLAVADPKPGGSMQPRVVNGPAFKSTEASSRPQDSEADLKDALQRPQDSVDQEGHVSLLAVADSEPGGSKGLEDRTYQDADARCLQEPAESNSAMRQTSAEPVDQHVKADQRPENETGSTKSSKTILRRKSDVATCVEESGEIDRLDSQGGEGEQRWATDDEAVCHTEGTSSHHGNPGGHPSGGEQGSPEGRPAGGCTTQQQSGPKPRRLSRRFHPVSEESGDYVAILSHPEGSEKCFSVGPAAVHKCSGRDHRVSYGGNGSFCQYHKEPRRAEGDKGWGEEGQGEDQEEEREDGEMDADGAGDEARTFTNRIYHTHTTFGCSGAPVLLFKPSLRPTRTPVVDFSQHSGTCYFRDGRSLGFSTFFSPSSAVSSSSASPSSSFSSYHEAHKTFQQCYAVGVDNVIAEEAAVSVKTSVTKETALAEELSVYDDASVATETFVSTEKAVTKETAFTMETTVTSGATKSQALEGLVAESTHILAKDAGQVDWNTMQWKAMYRRRNHLARNASGGYEVMSNFELSSHSEPLREVEVQQQVNTSPYSSLSPEVPDNETIHLMSEMMSRLRGSVSSINDHPYLENDDSDVFFSQDVSEMSENLTDPKHEINFRTVSQYIENAEEQRRELHYRTMSEPTRVRPHEEREDIALDSEAWNANRSAHTTQDSGYNLRTVLYSETDDSTNYEAVEVEYYKVDGLADYRTVEIEYRRTKDSADFTSREIHYCGTEHSADYKPKVSEYHRTEGLANYSTSDIEYNKTEDIANCRTMVMEYDRTVDVMSQTTMDEVEHRYDIIDHERMDISDNETEGIIIDTKMNTTDQETRKTPDHKTENSTDGNLTDVVDTVTVKAVVHETNGVRTEHRDADSLGNTDDSNRKSPRIDGFVIVQGAEGIVDYRTEDDEPDRNQMDIATDDVLKGSIKYESAAEVPILPASWDATSECEANRVECYKQAGDAPEKYNKDLSINDGAGVSIETQRAESVFEEEDANLKDDFFSIDDLLDSVVDDGATVQTDDDSTNVYNKENETTRDNNVYSTGLSDSTDYENLKVVRKASEQMSAKSPRKAPVPFNITPRKARACHVEKGQASKRCCRHVAKGPRREKPARFDKLGAKLKPSRCKRDRLRGVSTCKELPKSNVYDVISPNPKSVEDPYHALSDKNIPTSAADVIAAESLLHLAKNATKKWFETEEQTGPIKEWSNAEDIVESGVNKDKNLITESADDSPAAKPSKSLKARLLAGADVISNQTGERDLASMKSFQEWMPIQGSDEHTHEVTKIVQPFSLSPNMQLSYANDEKEPVPVNPASVHVPLEAEAGRLPSAEYSFDADSLEEVSDVNKAFDSGSISELSDTDMGLTETDDGDNETVDSNAAGTVSMVSPLKEAAGARGRTFETSLENHADKTEVGQDSKVSDEIYSEIPENGENKHRFISGGHLKASLNGRVSNVMQNMTSNKSGLRVSVGKGCGTSFDGSQLQKHERTTLYEKATVPWGNSQQIKPLYNHPGTHMGKHQSNRMTGKELSTFYGRLRTSKCRKHCTLHELKVLASLQRNEQVKYPPWRPPARGSHVDQCYRTDAACTTKSTAGDAQSQLGLLEMAERFSKLYRPRINTAVGEARQKMDIHRTASYCSEIQSQLRVTPGISEVSRQASEEGKPAHEHKRDEALPVRNTCPLETECGLAVCSSSHPDVRNIRAVDVRDFQRPDQEEAKPEQSAVSYHSGGRSLASSPYQGKDQTLVFSSFDVDGQEILFKPFDTQDEEFDFNYFDRKDKEIAFNPTSKQDQEFATQNLIEQDKEFACNSFHREDKELAFNQTSKQDQEFATQNLVRKDQEFAVNSFNRKVNELAFNSSSRKEQEFAIQNLLGRDQEFALNSFNRKEKDLASHSSSKQDQEFAIKNIPRQDMEFAFHSFHRANRDRALNPLSRQEQEFANKSLAGQVRDNTTNQRRSTEAPVKYCSLQTQKLHDLGSHARISEFSVGDKLGANIGPQHPAELKDYHNLQILAREEGIPRQIDQTRESRYATQTSGLQHRNTKTAVPSSVGSDKTRDKPNGATSQEHGPFETELKRSGDTCKSRSRYPQAFPSNHPSQRTVNGGEVSAVCWSDPELTSSGPSAASRSGPVQPQLAAAGPMETRPLHDTMPEATNLGPVRHSQPVLPAPSHCLGKAALAHGTTAVHQRGVEDYQLHLYPQSVGYPRDFYQMEATESERNAPLPMYGDRRNMFMPSAPGGRRENIASYSVRNARHNVADYPVTLLDTSKQLPFCKPRTMPAAETFQQLRPSSSRPQDDCHMMQSKYAASYHVQKMSNAPSLFPASTNPGGLVQMTRKEHAEWSHGLPSFTPLPSEKSSDKHLRLQAGLAPHHGSGLNIVPVVHVTGNPSHSSSEYRHACFQQVPFSHTVDSVRTEDVAGSLYRRTDEYRHSTVPRTTIDIPHGTKSKSNFFQDVNSSLQTVQHREKPTAEMYYCKNSFPVREVQRNGKTESDPSKAAKKNEQDGFELYAVYRETRSVNGNTFERVGPTFTRVPGMMSDATENMRDHNRFIQDVPNYPKTTDTDWVRLLQGRSTKPEIRGLMLAAEERDKIKNHEQGLTRQLAKEFQAEMANTATKDKRAITKEYELFEQAPIPAKGKSYQRQPYDLSAVVNVVLEMGLINPIHYKDPQPHPNSVTNRHSERDTPSVKSPDENQDPNVHSSTGDAHDGDPDYVDMNNFPPIVNPPTKKSNVSKSTLDAEVVGSSNDRHIRSVFQNDCTASQSRNCLDGNRHMKYATKSSGLKKSHKPARLQSQRHKNSRSSRSCISPAGISVQDSTFACDRDSNMNIINVPHYSRGSLAAKCGGDQRRSVFNIIPEHAAFQSPANPNWDIFHLPRAPWDWRKKGADAGCSQVDTTTSNNSSWFPGQVQNGASDLPCPQDSKTSDSQNDSRQAMSMVSSLRPSLSSQQSSGNASSPDLISMWQDMQIGVELSDGCGRDVHNDQAPQAQIYNPQIPSSKMPFAQIPNNQMPKAHIPNTHMPKAQVPKIERPNAQIPNIQRPNVLAQARHGEVGQSCWRQTACVATVDVLDTTTVATLHDLNIVRLQPGYHAASSETRQDAQNRYGSCAEKPSLAESLGSRQYVKNRAKLKQQQRARFLQKQKQSKNPLLNYWLRDSQSQSRRTQEHSETSLAVEEGETVNRQSWPTDLGEKLAPDSSEGFGVSGQGILGHAFFPVDIQPRMEKVAKWISLQMFGSPQVHVLTPKDADIFYLQRNLNITLQLLALNVRKMTQ